MPKILFVYGIHEVENWTSSDGLYCSRCTNTTTGNVYEVKEKSRKKASAKIEAHRKANS